MSDELDAPGLAAARSGRFGAPARFFASIGSTQTEVLGWAEEDAPEGAIVVADHQTAGRGRRGRRWLSSPGRALQFSVLLRPRLTPERAGLLTTALGVAVAEAIESTAGLGSRIRWPNDVTVGGRKLAGILVETRVARGALDVAVAGIGINVAWPCADLPPPEIGAGSISCELERAGRGPVPTRVEVLGAVLARLDAVYDDVTTPSGAARIVALASQRSETLGRAVSVRLADGGVVSGVAARLAPSGALALDVDGVERIVDAGEIERVRAR